MENCSDSILYIRSCFYRFLSVFSFFFFHFLLHILTLFKNGSTIDQMTDGFFFLHFSKCFFFSVCFLLPASDPNLNQLRENRSAKEANKKVRSVHANIGCHHLVLHGVSMPKVASSRLMYQRVCHLCVMRVQAKDDQLMTLHVE